MATDRMLATVLGAYHKTPDPSFTPKILGSTASLLTTLSNPLNISLLTSQLLTAPAVWEGPVQLDDCLKIISIFNSAAIKVLKQNEENDSALLGYPRQGGGLKADDWATTVVKGADEKSLRWRHCLVIAGILLGMESQQRRGLSRALRFKVETALVMAANLSLQEPGTYQLGKEAVLLALNHTFDLLTEDARRMINHDVLAPLAIDAMTGSNGYMAGAFVGLAGRDIRFTRDNRLDWPAATPSFQHHVKAVSSRPLITSMGPLARMVAFAITHLQQPLLQIPTIMERLSLFSKGLHQNWRANLLSNLDPSQLFNLLTQETFQTTYPALLQLLKSAMFATVVILQAITSRLLVDFRLSSQAPALAVSSLHILRNLYFITSRLGTNAFSALIFVSLTSLDILSMSPPLSAKFLQSIASGSPGRVPDNALDQCLDLYFLNTAEHFPLLLPPQLTTTLILASAEPYLTLPHRTSALTPTMTELFEAAHSATLSALAAPSMSSISALRIPTYAAQLLASFPSHLSVRQFRFAFKSLLQITTPPSEVARSHPRLPEELCEFLRFRAETANTAPMPMKQGEKETKEALENPAPQLSEQAALIISLIDGLPCLTPRQLEEWLPLTAEAVNNIRDGQMKGECKKRFWEILQGGEMDVDRSKTCVMWWTTRGGRELLVGKERWESDEVVMSGGLGKGGEARL